MLFSNVVVRGEEKIFVESPLFDSLGEWATKVLRGRSVCAPSLSG